MQQTFAQFAAGPASAAAVPSAATGRVEVDDAAGAVVLANGVQFAAGGYTVTGDALTLAAPGVVMRVGDGTGAGAAFVATIASPLTGTGGLEKTDLGTLILSGANTYSGGSTVSSGTLQGNSTSLQGAIAVAAQGTLVFDQTVAGAYAGALTGAGTLRKEGAGVLNLSGNSAGFVGTAMLANGGIALTGTLGSLAGGTLATASGTMLTGAGAVGNLDLGGTLAPGTGVGAATFNVASNAIIRSGSTFAVDLAASGAGDRLVAGGAITLQGGTVAINLLNPEQAYSDGQQFVIAQAGTGLSGTFATLSETSTFLDFSLAYNATQAILSLQQVRIFPDVAQTFNQTEASLALADLRQTAGTDALAVYNTILMLDEVAARAAFDATSGEIFPTILAERQRAGLALAGRIALRGRASGVEGLGLWAGVIGDRAHVDGDGNGAKSSYDNVGLEAGLDYRGGDNRWAIGAGAGWQDGQVDLFRRASRAEIDAWHIGGYARLGTSAAGLSAAVSVTYADASASA